MMCRCLKVSRSGYYAWLGREPSRTVRRRKELSALIEWVFNSSRGTYGYRRVHAAGARRGVETSPEAVRTRPCAPRARQAAQPRRKDPAPPPPGRRARARAPTWSGAGSRRRPAGSEVGGRYYVYPHLGGIRVPGDRPRLLHEESSRVRDWGDNTRHRPLVCEAIDMAARRCPHTTGGDGIPLDSTPAGGASTPPSSSPSIWGDMRSTLPRAGPECAGRVPGRKSAGATLKEREGLSDGVSHKKQDHPGYCLPGRARYTRSETTPLRPGVQDAGRGRPGAPSSKTSSLKDRFQGCPRHARQSKCQESGPMAAHQEPPPPPPSAPSLSLAALSPTA